MKTSDILSIILLLGCLLSCNKEQQGSTGGMVRHTLTAEIGKMETKAELGTGENPQVLWSAHEAVKVWIGETAYEFAGQNDAAASSAKFEGEVPSDVVLNECVLVSPRGASSSKSEGVISATLPAVQTASAGCLDPSATIIAGPGHGSSAVACKHLYSGFRFKVTRNDISKVTLSGLNNEKIAGNFTFSFDGSGNPVIGGGTVEEVVFTPSDGTYFTQNQWYYIAILPTTFTKGLVLTAESATSGTGIRTITESKTFDRAHLKNVAQLNDANMSWSTESATALNTCYGPTNTFCLRTGKSINIDVRPRRILSGWQRSSVVYAGAPHATSCVILWQNGTGITASLNYDWLTVTAGNTEGAALVAIKNGSTIIWSYLVWVTASAPAETTLPGGKKLLPALGGNCYFQWGRKDPLLSTATQEENNVGKGLAYAIAHPDTFIKGTDTADDWFCKNTGDQDDSLWGDGGLKTVWDPCPEGYRVPSEANYTNVGLDYDYLVDNFAVLGYISSGSGFYSSSRTYWTRTVGGKYSTSLDDGRDPDIFYGQTRDIAAPIRCVKE